MTEQNQIGDESGDRKYFIQTPQLVWALCRSPYDLSLWNTIKMIAGEKRECFLSTQDLATLSMMSAGKVKECRKYLLDVGLLVGEVRRDPGFQLPVWHLRIPNLWQKNINWREELGDLIADRVKLKAVQKRELRNSEDSSDKELGSPGEQPRSPGEQPRSPGEQPRSPGGHKEEPFQEPLAEPEVDPITATSVAESPATPPENSPEPRPSEGVDFLTHCADLATKNGQPWTVPTEAGGADGLGEAMLDAWLEQKGVAQIPDKLRAKWSRRLSKLALDSGLMCDDDGNPALTREQAIRAVEIVLEPGSAEFGYYTYNDPANRKFQQDWTEVALRLLNGGSGYKDGHHRNNNGKSKNKYSEEERAAQRKRLAKRGVFLD